MKWYRFYEEMVDDAKLLLLDEKYRWRYVAILAFHIDEKLQKTDEKLRDLYIMRRLSLTKAETFKTKVALVSAGLLQESWISPSWTTRQPPSDSSKKRTEEYRKNKQLSETCDGHVTEEKPRGDALDKNRIDKNRIDKNIKKSKKKKVVFVFPDDLKDKGEYLFDYWQQVFETRRFLSEERGQKIVDALTVCDASGHGFTLERLKKAIDGCKKNPFYSEGKNDRNTIYDDIELIFRSPKDIERFEKMAERDFTEQTHAKNTNPNAKPLSAYANAKSIGHEAYLAIRNGLDTNE